MANLSYVEQLKQQAREIAAEAAKAQKEAEAAQKAIDDADTFKKISALKTLHVLQDAVQKLIKHGLLSYDRAEVYLNKYLMVYGRDKAINEYLRLGALLLTQENFGVESTTARYGNKGLLWHGQSYESAEALYAAVQAVIGDDPLEHVQWIYSILDSVFSDDPSAIVFACSTPERFETYANLYRREVKEAKEPLSVPDLSQITSDDAFLLSSFFGQF
ncbi:hypothetical protein GNF10_12185 [Nostoc sp. UCD121]|uniref:hypothetical protein n=1 Tax=unclassified Nostoc TaxID=2593658 RepID=UPI0016240987|nr:MULTISPECIES: hypothetical protein [unclassified Nostoc]MBC1224156.1 hypothetical protein [Nostoc sp. UCD120]MBC1276722.1 hypothetical protein [Nostoc sp. UCD121]MBC1296570.1 hypothetical protein [Nostoc sp. UCD122]